MVFRTFFDHLANRHGYRLVHRQIIISRSLTTSFKPHHQLQKQPNIFQATNCVKLDDKILQTRTFTSEHVKGFEDRIWTVPNALCVLRILSSPLIAYTLINNKLIESIVIITVAGLTDFADGYIARRYESQRSALGAILDPIADKIFISTLYLSATICGQLPGKQQLAYIITKLRESKLHVVLITSIVIGRDLFLILGGSVMRYQMLPKPRKMSSFFWSKEPKMEVKSSKLSKWNTTLQFNLIGFTLAAPILNIGESILLTYFQYLVATTTIASGLDYMFNGNKYISSLKQTEESNK